MTISIPRLLELAEKATKGPYMASGIRVKYGTVNFIPVLWPDGRGHAYIPFSDATHRDFVQSHADANFTASCSPETILALCNAALAGIKFAESIKDKSVQFKCANMDDAEIVDAAHAEFSSSLSPFGRE